MRLYIFPLCGALVGLTIGVLLTSMTQMAYPLVQAGKPILSIPPMAVVTYESTMLTAIIWRRSSASSSSRGCPALSRACTTRE